MIIISLETWNELENLLPKKKKSSSSSSVVELLRGKRRGPNDKRRRVSLAPNGASPYVPPSLLIRAPPSSPYTQAPPIPRLALLLTPSPNVFSTVSKKKRPYTHTHTYTVIRESFLNRQMALYVLSLIWRKGYYGAYCTPSILRLFLFFFRR